MHDCQAPIRRHVESIQAAEQRTPAIEAILEQVTQAARVRLMGLQSQASGLIGIDIIVQDGVPSGAVNYRIVENLPAPKIRNPRFNV